MATNATNSWVNSPFLNGLRKGCRELDAKGDDFDRALQLGEGTARLGQEIILHQGGTNAAPAGNISGAFGTAQEMVTIARIPLQATQLLTGSMFYRTNGNGSLATTTDGKSFIRHGLRVLYIKVALFAAKILTLFTFLGKKGVYLVDSKHVKNISWAKTGMIGLVSLSGMSLAFDGILKGGDAFRENCADFTRNALDLTSTVFDAAKTACSGCAIASAVISIASALSWISYEFFWSPWQQTA